MESWLALRHQLPPNEAEIDLEAVAECGRSGAVSIARPRLGGTVLGQLAQVGEARRHSLIREERLEI